MIVVCEGCDRRFQVDDARIPERGARVRCKRCKHRFRVARPGTAGADTTPEEHTGDVSIDGEQSLAGTTLSPAAGTTLSPPAEATTPPPAEAASELRFVTEPPAGARDSLPESDQEASADEVAVPGEQTIGEGSWEFGDSSLSFDEATPPEPQAPAESSQSFIDGLTDDEEDPNPPEPAEPPPPPPPAPEEPGPAEDSTLRPVAPTGDSEAAIFEMPEDAAAEPLELAEEEPAEAEASPNEATVPPAPEPPAPIRAEAPLPEETSCELPEIGSAEDWDQLASDASQDAATAEAVATPATSAAPDACVDFGDLEDDEDPDWPDLSAEAEPVAEPPPAPRRGGAAWLEHAGWALSVVLLLSVAQGTVRIEPGVPGAPPGQLEVAGLSAENVRGRFVDNARSGTLFVVSGELHNRGTTPLRPEGALQVVLLDAAGQALAARPVVAGPLLPEQALREDPLGALAKRQEERAPDLIARELAPGEHLAFDAVVPELLDEAVRFRVEAVAR